MQLQLFEIELVFRRVINFYMEIFKGAKEVWKNMAPFLIHSMPNLKGAVLKLVK